MRTTPAYMRGMGAAGWLVAIAIGALVVTTAVQLTPVYMEYNTIRTAITNVIDDRQARMESVNEIRSSISRRFSVNNVESISARDLTIESGGGELRVHVEYEVRKPLFGNIDLVVHFDREFTRDLRS